MAFLLGADDLAAHAAQALDEGLYGALLESVVAGEPPLSWGDGEQGEHETGHGAGIVAIKKV